MYDHPLNSDDDIRSPSVITLDVLGGLLVHCKKKTVQQNCDSR